MPHSTLDGYLGCFQFSAVKHSVFVLLKIFLYNFWYTNARICWRYISRTIIAGYRVYLFSTFPEKAQLLSKGTVTLFSWQYWRAIFFLRFVHFTYSFKYTGHESFHHVLSDVCSIRSDPSPFYLGYWSLVPALNDSWSVALEQSGFRDHFPLWVLIFLSNVPWSFLIILSALDCFEEEAFAFLSSIFIF